MLVPTAILGLVLTAPPDEARPTVLTLSERAPLAYVLNTPSGERGRLGVSEILATLAEPLDEHTDLALTPVDSTAIAECEGALACLARRVPRRAELLLVLSYFAAGDRPDRISALLVDVASADACAADPFGADRIDECVSERAVKARPPPQNATDADAARTVLRALVKEELRPAFEGKGHWEPHGQVTLQEIPTGAAVLVDERTVGVASGGPIRLEGLPIGEHRVAYSVQGELRASETVVVAAGTRPEVRFVAPGEGGFEAPLLYGGSGLAALGVGLSVWSLAYAAGQSDKRLGCDGDQCGSSFYTLERQFRGDIDVFEENPNRGRVLALPLGYALILTGATWAVGSQLVEDDSTLHWIIVGAGVLAGGLAYGISAAANGP